MKYIFIILGVLLIPITIAAGLIWVERRLLALFQDRYGPNRVGPFGLFQVMADMIKIFTKEDWIAPFADKAVFVLAPGILMITIMLTFAVVPFSPNFFIVDSNIAYFSSWVIPRLGYTALFSGDGLPTASIHCLDPSGPLRKCLHMKCLWDCRWQAL
jgi:NADH-quinone oxidoreductase subunit H